MRASRLVVLVVATLLGGLGVASAQEDYVVLRALTDGIPVTGLIQASDGNFYGSFIGNSAMFRLTPDGTYTPLNNLGLGALIQASDGYLYGNTQDTVHRIALTGESDVLAVFANHALDGLMTGPIVEGDDGNFYGISRSVFSETPERIFSVSPEGVVTTVHTFSAADGPALHNRLMKGRDGSFYGSTSLGGTGHGTLFQFRSDGSFVTLHAFGGGGGGSMPRAQLLEGTDDAFYGTTFAGGTGCGTVFRFHLEEGFKVLHAFGGDHLDGCEPGALTEGSDGYLYGITPGTAFKMTKAGSHVQVLHRVDAQAEAERYGFGLSTLVEGADGNFYGTALYYGPGGSGAIFRLNSQRTPCANDVELEYQTDGTNGTLYFTQVLKGEMPALIGAWLVSAMSIDTLWLAVVPPITPTSVFAAAWEPFPSIGHVGVFSFVLTSDLVFCGAWRTVDTGGAGPTADTLREQWFSDRPR